VSEERRPTLIFRIPTPGDVYVCTSRATACPLGPIETEVMARIDGETSLVSIAALLNLTFREVATVAERLVELGATERRADEVDAGWEEPESESPTAPPPAGEGP
jgi:hypothetical protein